MLLNLHFTKVLFVLTGIFTFMYEQCKYEEFIPVLSLHAFKQRSWFKSVLKIQELSFFRETLS